MLPNFSKKNGPYIGLDIGSQAVRAAELTVHDGHQTLQRYAEVRLPPGAVADGEVVDSIAVGHALKQLWAEGKFSKRKVVVGVSSQRAIVRLADVPAMTDSELRTALKFEAGDLIPIPVEEAVLDFSTIDRQLPSVDPSQPPTMRILLAAAHRDMVNGHLAALKAGGLKPLAVDPVALALLRAIPPAAPASGERNSTVTEAVVAIGAGRTTVAIRENGIARFVRVLNLGGDDLAHAADLPPDPVVGTGPVGNSFGVTALATRGAAVSVGGSLRALVEDIRGSLDFYLAQADTDRVNRIVVTGGAAMTDGLLTTLQDALRQAVEVAAPLSNVVVGKVSLTADQLDQAAPYLVTPIGLALWGTVAGRPISLLPDEVLQAKRKARQSVGVAIAVTAFAVVLGLAWGGRMVEVRTAQRHARAAHAQAATLQAQISALGNVTTVQANVKAGQQLYAAALSKDVDWIRLIQQVTAVMPPSVHLSNVTISKTPASVGAATVGANPVSEGFISFSGVSANGMSSVADWLRGLETLPGLSGAWVQTISQGSGPAAVASGGPAAGTESFNASAAVTPAAESQRSADAAKASQ